MQRNDGYIREDITSAGAAGIAGIGVNPPGEQPENKFGEPPKRTTLKILKRKSIELKDKNVTG